jgi:hypothetical protein
MSIYSQLVDPNFRYTYACINRTSGEVFTMSCDDRATALKRVYYRAQSELRYYSSRGKSCDLLLINCVTGAEVLVIKR